MLVDLAPAAADEGIEMSVVAMRPLTGFPYVDDLRRAGVTVTSLEIGGWWDPRGPHRLARLLPGLRADVLHSHLKHADVVGGRAAKRAGIPHVSTLHLVEEDVGWFAARKRDLATRSRLRTAATTIAVSDAVRDWYLSACGAAPESVETIYNGVPEPAAIEPAEAEALRGELGVPRDAVVAAMVAVMRPGKGHDGLLDALRLVERDVVVVLAGDGPDEERLRTRANGLDGVIFAGFRDDVGRILAASDFVVHPSLSDALPTALIHALAAGRPIVASRVGGIPEIVPPDGGELVAPGDPVALAAAIDRLAADSDGRRWMGKRARERYDQLFTDTMWATRLRSVYDSIL